MGGGKWEKALNGYTKKKQNQVAIKHKTKIYTAVRYFAMKIGRN